jgi:hypothetical protein
MDHKRRPAVLLGHDEFSYVWGRNKGANRHIYYSVPSLDKPDAFAFETRLYAPYFVIGSAN